MKDEKKGDLLHIRGNLNRIYVDLIEAKAQIQAFINDLPPEGTPDTLEDAGDLLDIPIDGIYHACRSVDMALEAWDE